MLDGLVGVSFAVTVGSIDTYSEDMALADGERLDLAVVTYVSQGSRAASPTSSASSAVSSGAQSVIPAMTGEGDSALPPTGGSAVPSGIWPVLLLLGGTIVLVSLATRIATQREGPRR